MVRIAHVSDFHIGSHSDEIWEELTKSLNDSDIDVFAFTGDITEHNDRIHFQRFLDWITDEIGISDNRPKFGLKLGQNYQDRVLIIPGNHDYFINNIGRLVKDSSFFYSVFPTSKCPNWAFFWNEEGPNLFIVSLDSNHKKNTIAKGEVSREDIQRIAGWCDEGRHGKLLRNNKFLGRKSILDQKEARSIYRKSIKILLIHHYLFLPDGRGNEPLMGLENAQDLLAQAACDDFDLVLSGHDHHDYVGSHEYQTAFKKKSIRRFARMYCTRQLGIKRLPCFEMDHKGNLLKRTWRIALDFLREQIDGIEERLVTKKYKGFGLTLDQFQRRKGIRDFITIDLSNRKTKKIVSKIAEIIEKEMQTVMQGRALIHGIAPSATKANEECNGFAIYEVKSQRNIEITRYNYEKNNGFISSKTKYRSYTATLPADHFNTEAYKLLSEEGLFADD